MTKYGKNEYIKIYICIIYGSRWRRDLNRLTGELLVEARMS
jgi:hypothetical protein